MSNDWHSLGEGKNEGNMLNNNPQLIETIKISFAAISYRTLISKSTA